LQVVVAAAMLNNALGKQLLLQLVLKKIPARVAFWRGGMFLFKDCGVAFKQLRQAAAAECAYAVELFTAAVALHFNEGQVLLQAFAEVGEYMIEVQVVVGFAGIKPGENCGLFKAGQGTAPLCLHQQVEQVQDVTSAIEKG
jgi:hypothetical protein